MGLKRILSLLTVTVLVGTSVVGCSSSNGGDSSGNASGDKVVVDIFQFKVEAKDALEKEQFAVSLAEVLAIEVEDQPGGLEAALDLINEENINVEYIYAFVEKKTQKALVVLRTENNDKSQEILTSNGFSLLNQDEAYTL